MRGRVVTAPVRFLLAIAMLASLAIWYLPVSAQAQSWSCDVPAPATPAPSSTPAATPGPVAFPVEGGKLTVFAAASLTDAFTKLADDLKAAYPNLDITFNFAGSQALVTQIAEGGAQADVLALASPAQMKSAVEAGIPVEGPATFVTNRLAVVVPADNPAGIASVADLAKDGVRLVLANPDVPAGNYARQSLCKTAAAGGPSVEDYAANIVSEEDNVRSVLTKVELGEADAGIVYVTDALTSGDKVQSIEIPADQNVVASYPIATIGDNPLAAAFVGYIFSPEGQATLASFGFDPVSAT
jgi:molybdate transport system substrate-binding protein